MTRFLYICPNTTTKYHIRFNKQLTILGYIGKFMDVVEINHVTDEMISQASVVCLDFLAIFPKYVKNQNEPYYEIIKKCPNVCLLCLDLHAASFGKRPDKGPYAGKHYGAMMVILNKLNIKHVISKCDCPEFHRMISEIKLNTYILSWHIDHTIFRNYYGPRDIDVVLFGSCNQRVYPLRFKIKQSLKKMRGIKCIILKSKDPKNYGEGLAKILNRAWITICTASIFDYLVCKYFEAAACGSVVAGNMCSQGKEIWGDNFIYIPNGSTRVQIISIISKALADKNRLRQIGDHMSEKIMTEYNYGAYAKKLHDICQDIVVKSANQK